MDAAKTTTNNIYAVVSGRARFTAEGGLDETLAPGDVIAVPCWHEHAIEAPEDTVVLRVSDEPLLAKLGLGRTRGSLIFEASRHRAKQLRVIVREGGRPSNHRTLKLTKNVCVYWMPRLRGA